MPDMPPHVPCARMRLLCGQVRAAMAEAGATAVVVTALDELAWLFNIRGSDIPFNPVTYVS